MFAAMCDYFIRQIKIAKHYYISQYGPIERAAKKDIKRTQFGAMVDMYIHALYSGNMKPFETESGKHMLEYIESAVKVEVKESPTGKYFNIAINKNRVPPEKNELNIEKATVEHERAQQMLRIHNNNAIISLMIRLENFLTDYFVWIIEKYPSKYLSEKNIKYSELLKYDFENLKKELSLEAANSIMSQPQEEWWKTIKSHKFDLNVFAEHMANFKEVYYRRNLIVHNDGKINRQYLNGINKQEGELKLGEKLITDKKYVINAFDTAMIIIYGLLYASLKANPEDKSEYISHLFSVGFNHMVDNDWTVSCFIFKTLLDDNSQDEMGMALTQINYWIANKNLGRFADFKDQVIKRDFSAMNVSLRMAKEMLLENYQKAIPLLDEALLNELTPDNVETWPLFIQFRKTEHYKEFRKKYEKQLDSQVIKSEEINEQRNEEQDKELKEAFKKEDAEQEGVEEE